MTSYEQLKKYDDLAIENFEAKKKYEKVKDKENAKLHKEKTAGYDKLAFDILENMNIINLYKDQISRENTRAMRSVRYFYYRRRLNIPLQEKEDYAVELIKMALQQSERPSLSCSFGIDSMVTLHLTRRALVELGRDPSDIEVVWCNTLNEFPEVRLFSKRMEKEWDLNLKIQLPEKPLKKIINEHGGVDSSYFFSRKGSRTNNKRQLSEKCCGVLKHKPMQKAIKENDWDLQLNGVRADESSVRLRSCLRDGEYYYSSAEWKAFLCRPISWWNEEEVWQYVAKHNIPFPEMYDNNLIQEYPDNLDNLINTYIEELNELNVDIDKLKEKQLAGVNKQQSLLLKRMKFKLFTPRVGCLACPIPWCILRALW